MLKKLTVAAILLTILGIGGSVLTYTASNQSIDMNESQTINYENIDAIEIETISTDVEIIASNDQQDARIELKGRTNDTNPPVLSVKEQGSKLIIDLQSEKKDIQWFQLSPNFAPDTLALKVYVPEKLLNSITVGGVSADLYLDNIHAETMTFKSTSGDIDAYNLQFENAYIQTVSGDVGIDELVGKIAIKTTSGDISLAMMSLSYPIQIDSTSGDVELVTENELTDVKFKIQSVSGDINILDEYNGSTVIGNGTTLAEIETTSGDISVENY